MIKRPAYSYRLVVSRIVGFALVALLLSGCSLFTASGPPWIEMHPRVHPVQHGFAFPAAYDAATRQVVLYDGGTNAAPGTQTWAWNGRDWTELHLTVHPPHHQEAVMAYDAQTKKIVLVVPLVTVGNFPHRYRVIVQHMRPGKATSAFVEQLYAETRTWTWNGTSWTELHPSASPLDSFGASMAYDAATGNVVFAGRFGHSFETWTWNGVTWTQQHPTKSPSARLASAMAYDPQVREVLLFGGTRGAYSGAPVFGDTWAWNGSTWMRLHPSASPSARFLASMAYDPQIRELVLFGGTSMTRATSGPLQQFGDTWAWNGATWIRLHPSASPPPLSASSMAYDAATKGLVLFGGRGPYHHLSDTWSLKIPTHSPRHVGRTQ